MPFRKKEKIEKKKRKFRDNKEEIYKTQARQHLKNTSDKNNYIKMRKEKQERNEKYY